MKEDHRETAYQQLTLVALGMSLFLIYTLFTAKFMVTIYNQEHFLRLHARYHFMTYSIFIITFAVFAENIRWTAAKTLIFLSAFVLVTLSNIYYIFPIYVTQGLTIFDNPDMAWFVPPASTEILAGIVPLSNMEILAGIIPLIGIVIFFLAMKGRSPLSYLFYFAAVLLMANFGEVRNIIFYDTINSKRATVNRHFIQGSINDPNASVMLVESTYPDRLWTAFWLPYNYTNCLDLQKGSSIKKE
ncbi:MAG: hypothetical protein AAB276_01445, partial [Pseudomonadota bacterium]